MLKKIITIIIWMLNVALVFDHIERPITHWIILKILKILFFNSIRLWLNKFCLKDEIERWKEEFGQKDHFQRNSNSPNEKIIRTTIISSSCMYACIFFCSLSCLICFFLESGPRLNETTVWLEGFFPSLTFFFVLWSLGIF